MTFIGRPNAGNTNSLTWLTSVLIVSVFVRTRCIYIKKMISSKRKSGKKVGNANKKIKLELSVSTASFEQKLEKSINQLRSISDVQKNNTTDIIDVPIVYEHRKLEFLFPENLCDANKRRSYHPNYDPTTLCVPTQYLDSQTPV